MKRAVWERDGGRCTYVSPDGRRCESRWQLEYDHVDAAALGGPSTVENTRLRCRPHNLLHADETFGREHMARFRREERSGSKDAGTTIAGESAPLVNARTPHLFCAPVSSSRSGGWSGGSPRGLRSS